MTEPRDSQAEHQRLWLRLEPVDTLFFRDGRPFDPASRATSGLPNPQTLAGALRTEMLRRADIDLAQMTDHIRNGDRFETAAARVGGSIGEQIAKVCFRGPHIGRTRERAGAVSRQDTLFYPAPATLRRLIKREAGDDIVRLDPAGPDLSLPGWTPQADGLVPLWTRSGHVLKPLDRKTWITGEGLSTFLSGAIPSGSDLVSSDDLYGFEDRTGIAVAPETGTAAEGMIYATRRLVLRSGVYFRARLEGSPEALDLLPKQNEARLLPFGGEGRQVVVTGFDAGDAPVRAEPATGTSRETRGKCLVLVTPAFFQGWHPPDIDLLAAAVPDHVPVSGWDLARGGPKPTRFAIAAGSVYF
ncbi:MAG: type III-B CRISPR module-associated protein Cmr3, partial [Hyphomonadaceae bacterium]|nr:type III-B CRISPR module-associated protein Cmr3 [Hyphomonadaceae bacterium]